MTIASRNLLIGALSVAAVAANAQPAQTIDSAQHFLEVTGKNLPLDFPWDRKIQDGSVVSSMEKHPTYHCFTKWHLQLDYTYQFNAKIVEHVKKPATHHLGWKNIAEVKQEGQNVRLFQAGTVQNDGRRVPPFAYSVRYPSEALATRAAYAMEFLRSACDETAGLAF